MSNQAAILDGVNKQLHVENRDIPSPQDSEILVKNVAIALNPVDWKIQDYGPFITQWPNILGSDVSGIVEAVGPKVTHFQKGDRVTGFATVISNNDPSHGAFQQYSLVYDNAAAKIPESLSYDEGSILPMAIATAGVGIFLSLGIPRPGGPKQSGGFLVTGASSSVGTAVIQVAASLGYTVYGVCSSQHHSYVRKLGASHVFDYKDQNIVTNVIKAAKSDNDSIKVAYDAISEGASVLQTVGVLEAFGGGKLCLTLPFPEGEKKPDNIEVVNTAAFRINTDAKDFGRWLFNEWLENSLADKTYVPSPKIERVDGGLASAQKALDILRKGVSGTKLVLPLA
ncbi:MAG: hypothetical protein LQ342_006245 [Letrouitia transgressa]|nr:MAG: hypothetical protein LQ342_006245 [Letrouitia transgressa]